MPKILIVDDETAIRSLCYEIFTREGYEVITVARGDQALEEIVRERPDVVLMDLMIPGEEGLSLLRRMPKEKGKRIPVIIFSGYVTPENEKAIFEAGAVDVIQKGVAFAEIKERISRVIKNKERILDPENIPRGKEKILVVDDEIGIRQMIAGFFEGLGFTTLQAEDGETAIRLIKKQKPVVVLLDLNLPGMDGMLTLKKIREFDQNVGVIIITGMSDEILANEAIRQLGAYDYITKPFDLKYLELVVRSRIILAS